MKLISDPEDLRPIPPKWVWVAVYGDRLRNRRPINVRDLDLIPAHFQEHDAVAEAQSAAEIKDELKRKMARMRAYNAWSQPEAVKARWEHYEAEKERALEFGKSMGRNLELLPVPDPLPDCMKGQSASTIQAMLRSGWRPDAE